MWNGSTLSFNVDQTTDGERVQEGGKLDGDLAVILKDGESATINPTIALGVEDGTYTYANNFATEDNTKQQLQQIAEGHPIHFPITRYGIIFLSGGRICQIIKKSC